MDHCYASDTLAYLSFDTSNSSRFNKIATQGAPQSDGKFLVNKLCILQTAHLTQEWFRELSFSRLEGGVAVV